MKYNLKLLFGQKYIDIIHKKVNVKLCIIGNVFENTIWYD
mgnify:FL=1